MHHFTAGYILHQMIKFFLQDLSGRIVAGRERFKTLVS
jgi:hypothetical protein